ncbi:hypothetical protein GCM10025768_03100 [Microbacterium pseudoresistens]|uniref:Uncharacterized protein n=1 Tax=Microbacterium pseudoresistens TaxID=640634 RepID=A0A7Y9EUM3_9MICO|nr:hypothetical protein [Microbacterium pseudoresistens]
MNARVIDMDTEAAFDLVLRTAQSLASLAEIAEAFRTHIR